MLHAIHKNKAGQSLKSEEIHWRTLFKKSEDSLTSTVFERLFYLPVDMFWKILKSSCYKNNLPNNADVIQQIEFWPHWDVKNVELNGEERNLIEPDVFIRFKDFDLIIEAKIDKSNKQQRYQWEWQINSYIENYKEDIKPLYYIALDGINNNMLEKVSANQESNKITVEIIKCTWQKMLYETINQLSLVKKQVDSGYSMDGITRILEDIKLAFETHGYFTGEWFESMPTKYILNHTNLYNKLEWEN